MGLTITRTLAFSTVTTAVACIVIPSVAREIDSTRSNRISSAAPTPLDSRWSEVPHTDTEFVPRRYSSLDEWNRRRGHLRKQILWAAGLWPMPVKTPLRARVFDRVERDGYTVEKVYFESLPGLFVTGNLYRPTKTSTGNHPGVLNPHGHSATGRLHDDLVVSAQARCITFARMGCVAFMWDMIGYNDSGKQLAGRYENAGYRTHFSSWKHGRNRLTLWNINSLGLQLWNSIRALDFLSSLPEVDSNRLACTGESGGGTQTFLLSAVDNRVKVAAPVCMISAYMQGGCTCENAPGLRIDANNVDFGAMMAPRPLMLVSSKRDWTSHTSEVEFPAIKQIYEFYGSSDKVAHAHFDAKHGYNRDMRNAVYPWFANWLGLSIEDEFSEPKYLPEHEEDLLVFNQSVPDYAIRDHDQLVEQIIEFAEQRINSHQPFTQERLAENRELFGQGLRLSVGMTSFDANDFEYHRHGDHQLAGISGERGTLIGTRRGIRIPLWVFHPPETNKKRLRVCSLLLHGKGRAALASQKTLIQDLLDLGHTVYAPELFGLRDAPTSNNLVRERDTSHHHFSTFNRSDDAERVYDIVTATRYCQWHGAEGKPVTSVCVSAFDEAGPWAVVAAALLDTPEASEPEVRFAIDLNRFDVSSEAQYLAEMFIPGILCAGGLSNAASMVAPRTLLLYNADESFEASRVTAAYALDHLQRTKPGLMISRKARPSGLLDSFFSTGVPE